MAHSMEQEGIGMKRNGFTFMELLIVLTLAGILLTYCLVNASALGVKNEKRVFMDEVIGVVQYARLQALVLGEPVSLMPLDSQGDWSKGVQLVTTQTLIRQWPWRHKLWRLEWKGAHAAHKIMFSPSLSQAMSNGRFVFTQPAGLGRGVLVMNRLGRLYEKDLT
jgi:prepilin-type N-terminal cleavage/methylation domain-containing protein